MIILIAFALVGLVVGVLCYSGLWRGWTGRWGIAAWGLGALWVGIGFALFTISQLLQPLVPEDSALPPAIGLPGALIAVLGGMFCFWTPPFLRPRWYRSQYTPLVRRRR